MKKLFEVLKELNFKISFAESCTGGFLASSLTDIENSSLVFEESYVTYSDEAKIKILGVEKEIIAKYTAYSSEVCQKMVEGLKAISNAEICVSITGIAGEKAFIANNEIFEQGRVLIGILINEDLVIKDVTFKEPNNSRQIIKEKVADYLDNILSEMLKSLK